MNSVLVRTLAALTLLIVPHTACQREQPRNDENAATASSLAASNVHMEGDVPMIGADFAKVYYDSGQAKFLDVRGDTAFGAERIAGATSVSLLDIRNGIFPDWPRDQLIVAYCGCPHSMSAEAAGIMRRRGFSNVYVLNEGFYYWKEKGYPIEADTVEGKPLRRMTIRGQATGLPPGTPVYAAHEPSGQLEAAEVHADGSFELHLPFYGVGDGEPIRVYADGREAIAAFSEAGTEVSLLAK